MVVSLPLLDFSGVPDNGVSEVQLLTPTGTISGGSFTLTFNAAETDPIDWDATIADIQAALVALSTIGDGGIVCTGDDLDPDLATQLSDGGVVTVTFSGVLAGLPVPEIVVDDSLLTGTLPVVTPSTDTAGVRGTYRGAQGGALLQDTTNGVLYQNTGTAQVPVWSDWANL